MQRTAIVPVTADLLEEAKALDINLSAALETGIRQAIAGAKGGRWLSENAEAIAQYNKWVEKHGLPLDRYRQF